MLYPLPVVLVTVSDGAGIDNVFTVAWTGTVCTNPAMVSVSVRPERYSYELLKKTGEFVINLTTEKLALATDFCGVRSGRDMDKFQKMKLTKTPASVVNVPMIQESPVNIECRVTQVLPLGSHDLFLARVVAAGSISRRRNLLYIPTATILEQAGNWENSVTASGKDSIYENSIPNHTQF